MFTIRRATAADRDALEELCRASVGPDDYVPDFLEDFLATGVVFVAEDEDRPVGMMAYHDVPDGSAWLHAARTRPDYRRRGVATGLMKACEELAASRRRTAFRLWASADNVASVTANRLYGLRERARFTRMRITAAPGAAPSPEPFDMDRDWPALEASPILRTSAGYVFHDFYFLPLDRANAARLSSEGALLRFGDNVVSVSEDYEVAWGKDLQIQPLLGDPGAILRACPALAAARGADRVETFLPHDLDLLTAAQRAGFAFMDWGQQAILFEKVLRA